MKKLLASLLLASFLSPAAAQQLAFPGAEGFGRFAQGGRGGAVIQVTNLQDNGVGSLRACVEATGPRTCVFRVAGTIELDGPLDISNPYLTIAGQTAPGQGVQLKNRNSLNAPLRVLSKHVVIRHIRSRPGPSVAPSDNVDSARISGVGSLATTNDITDIMLDHLSLFWSTDELLDNSPWADRITAQNMIFAEGLNLATHPSGPHSKGPNLRGCGISIIRSLISTNVIRNPNNTCGRDTGGPRGGGGVTGENEFRNNVVYNGRQGFFDYFNGRGDSEANLAGNVFVRGPATLSNNTAPYAVDARDVNSPYTDNGLQPGSPGYLPAGTTDAQKLCLQDNISIGFPGDAGAPTSRAAEIHGVLDPRDANIVLSTDCVNNPVGNVAAQGGIRGLTGPVVPSGQVEALIQSSAGAFPWNRDAADVRVLANLANRTSTIINDPSEVGGWPVLATGTPYPDADADGMSDAFEAANGLNSSNAADRNGDLDGDGYTNLEEFLSQLAGDVGSPPPPPPLPTISISIAIPDRYETNTGNVQPFTFTVTRTGDLSGTSTVTAKVEGVGASPANSADFYSAIYLNPVTLTFGPGVATIDRTVIVKGDTTVEPNETFQGRLYNPTNAVIGTATAGATILNDDGAGGSSALVIGGGAATTGRAAVHSTLGGSRTGVRAAGDAGVIVDGPAKSGGDNWWKVDFQSNPDGWVRQSSLAAQ